MSRSTQTIDYAVLFIWHKSMTVEQIAEQISVDPSMWFRNGESIDGKLHEGNAWTFKSDHESPTCHLAEILRSHSQQIVELVDSGAKINIRCHYRPEPDAGIPELNRDESILFANLRIDVLFIQIHRPYNSGLN